MASPESVDPKGNFAEVEESISSVLDKPIRLLTERKKYLLGELNHSREEYIGERAEHFSIIEELIASRDELKCISSLMKENQAQGELTKSIINLEEKISALEQELPPSPNIQFKYEFAQLQRIENFILNFGELDFGKTITETIDNDKKLDIPAGPVEKPIANIQPKKAGPPQKPRDYSLIKTHQTKLAKFGKEESDVTDPGCIYIDEANDHVYICDGGNGRIQIWTTEGEYLREFGKDQLVSPVGIILYNEAIYITDFFKKSLFKYNSDFTYVKKFGRKPTYKFNYPHSIDAEDDELFIAEPFKHKISVFSPDLEYKRTLGVGIIKKCYGIKVRDGVINALEYNANTIKQLQANTGDLIRSIPINNDGISNFNYTFLATDPYGNFIVTDMVADMLKILNPDGEVISSIYFERWKSHEPKAIAFTSDNKIFIGFSEGESSILII
ncbi:E3 ubiquitin-protein ligase TRIM71 [Oopsacas minuta]|uniref:E3 ubiquitin-protein ligase TRIM71 n=1 Tax=Oopsacas minuta TaxID=111878 RepID=A0AAV7JXH3_9METZ|nr:E3 ubiquitin-protein ligase TRIM71 [Oopsacas minuta]